MTTETEVRLTAFESYVERTLPAQLREGAAVPGSWTGDPEAWEALADTARAEFRRRATFDYAQAIACRGYQPQELATGELDRGATVKVATGEVKRPPRSTLSPELELNARQALGELQARHLTLDVPLQIALEGAAAGGWTSEPGQVIGAVKAAGAAVRAYDREHEVAREEKAAKVTVRVLATAGPGRRYSPGVYSLSAEELQELKEWGRHVEEGARGRSLRSLGHSTWPAFVVVEA